MAGLRAGTVFLGDDGADGQRRAVVEGYVAILRGAGVLGRVGLGRETGDRVAGIVQQEVASWLGGMDEQVAGGDRALGGVLRYCPAACQIEGAIDRQGAVPENPLTACAAVLQREIGRVARKDAVSAEGNPADVGVAAEDQSARTDPGQLGGVDRKVRG